MSESKVWKSQVLSTGVPLEIDVARVLSDAGFSIFPEFCYEREVGGGDCSVDLLAFKKIPHPEQKLPIELFLLVECKFRSPNKKMLYFPHVGDWYPSPLKIIDRFSFEHLGKRPLMDFCEALPKASKGLDIDFNFNSASAKDDEIRDGLRQLQFGTSTLLKQLVEDSLSESVMAPWSTRFEYLDTEPKGGKINLILAIWIKLLMTGGNPESWSSFRLRSFVWLSSLFMRKGPAAATPVRIVRPFLVGNLLVTNSELRLAKHDITLDMIRQADKLEEYSEEVNRLVVPGPSGPALARLCENLFRDTAQSFVTRVRELDDAWKGSEYHTASNELAALKKGKVRFDTVVCSLSGLLETVSEVCSVASVSARHSNFVGMPKSLRAELERKIWRISQEERLRKVIGDAKRASENLAAAFDDAISSASKKEE